MNMIVNSSDLVGYEAETKKETNKAMSKAQALRNLLKVWEGKQLKASKKAAGLSFLAVSLAACNSNDDTPYGEADITAAKAEGVASVDITSDNAAAVTAALTGADGTVYSDVAAAVAAGAASVDITSNDADVIAPVQASLDTLQASYDALVTSNTTLQASYDALVSPKSLALTAATAADTLIGGSGDDAFTGTTATIAAADSIIDQSTTDNDTLTIAATGDVLAMTVTNVENIVVNGNALGTTDIDAANFSGATSLTVTRGDVTVAGATITGNKTVTVNNLSSDGVASVTAGAGSGAFTQTAAATDIAGYTLNLDNVTGASAINVEGASTLNAANTTGTITYGDANNDTKAETDKPITINAANAGSFVTHSDYDGLITINGGSETGATAMDINNAIGGITINSASSAAGDKTYAVDNIDASGGTITVGTGFTTTALGGTMTMNLDGTTANTDAITINAAGTVALDLEVNAAQQIDTAVLGGNGAAVIYNLVATSTPGTTDTLSFTKTGDQAVTIAGDFDHFGGYTITNIDTVDITAVTTAATIDGTLWTGVGNIDLGVDNANNAITLNSGAKVTLTADQTTGLDINFVSGGDLTIVAGDDNGTSSAVGTIDAPTLAPTAAATATGTVTLEATVANWNSATATTLGALQTLVVTGDEDVTLGTLTAAGIDASGSSGIINLTATTGVGSGGITTGSGADVIVINGAAAHTVVSGAGNDTITATATNAGSSIDAGAGNDTINADDVSVMVYAGGAGNDNFATAANLAGTIVGGEGTDTITIDAGATVAFDTTTFAMSGIEIMDITLANSTVTITDANLTTNPTFAVTGGTNDTLVVASQSTAAAAKTIDGSGVTLSSGSTAAVTYTGGVGADTFTGGVVAETFTHSLGADTHEGGSTGVDTYLVPDGTDGSTADPDGTGASGAATGMVINMSSSAVSAATVTGAASKYAANSITSIAAGEVVYLYDAAAATNSSVTDTISGIENFTSSDAAGVEYVVGSTGNNVISTGAGVDYIVAGAGADTITGGAGADIINLGASDAESDTVVFVGTAGGGDLGDVITGFEAGAGGDIIDFTTPDSQMAATDPTTVFDTDTTIDDTTGVIVHGTTVTQGASATVAQATAGLTVGTFDAAGSTNDTVYIAFDDATHTYIGVLDSNAGDNGFTGDTLTIICTLNNVLADALTAANFADFT